MKIKEAAAAILVLGILPVGTVWADGVRQPASARQAAFEYDNSLYFAADDAADESPSDRLESEIDSAACVAACEPCSCDSCGDCCSGGDCGVFAGWLARDPWKLPQPCLLQSLGINTGGWLQAGITMNGEDPGDNINGPVLTNDRHAELQMNELWLYFHRPVETGGYGVDVGGRVDLLYGTDWRVAYLHGYGIEDKINAVDRFYGFAIPQMYLEVAVDNLSVKLGRMTGVLGYEIVPPMGNFFYSHSYALCYGEPILITGLMANYKLSDQWTVLGGFHQGIHRFEDNNDRLNFEGGLMWTSRDERVSLAYAVDFGRNDFFTPVFHLEDEYVHSFVLKYQLSENLLYVLQNDAGFANGTPGNPDAEWYGINQYFLYTINETWSAGLRVEWFRDDDGTRVLGVGNLSARAWIAAPGFAGDFTELTLGLNWKPKANITFRPEVRWDWYDGPANAAGPYPLPYDNGTSSSQFTLAADVIVTF
ncbi:MAG: porin [Candidatus Nealsonbacteria bacterium]|nr:porin [Candidatus Nealsonbacteria bacterium]